MFEITGGIPEPIFNEPQEAESPGEDGRPWLEVRRCGDGHPPVTKREREIRLNGIGGVILKNPDRNFDPGFFVQALPRNGGFQSA